MKSSTELFPVYPQLSCPLCHSDLIGSWKGDEGGARTGFVYFHLASGCPNSGKRFEPVMPLALEVREL